MTEIDSLLHQSFQQALMVGSDPFDLFIAACRETSDRPAHTMGQLRARKNTKVRGDYFEAFCKRYLERLEGLTVWFLHDLPSSLRVTLHLPRRDNGIDLIAKGPSGYIAVQCKYRKASTRFKVTALTWNDLATFYALCAHTGPWAGLIVMTNAERVLNKGHRLPNERVLCRQSFRGLSQETWLRLLDDSGHRLGSS